MDVGTAKVDAEIRAGIPHHLIDVIDPWESWSVQRFQAEARAAGTIIEDDGEGFAQIVSFLENLKVI